GAADPRVRGAPPRSRGGRGGRAGGVAVPRARERIPTGHRARLAPRRAELRARGRRVARQPDAHALPPLPAAKEPPRGHVRARARAAIRLRPARRCTLALAALDSADQGPAVLDHLPHAPSRRRECRRHAGGGSAGSDSRTITSLFTLSAPSIAL